MNQGDNDLNIQVNSEQSTNIRQKKSNKSKALTIGLITSIMNFIFCGVLVCINSFFIYKEVFNVENDVVSGWLFIFAPVMILIYAISFFPDAVYTLFSILAYEKENNIYIMLMILSLVLGYIISGLAMYIGVSTEYLHIIYRVVKVILILYNIVVLILINIKKKENV